MAASNELAAIDGYHLLEDDDLQVEYDAEEEQLTRSCDNFGCQRHGDDGERLNWKSARPSFVRSLLFCAVCAFSATFVCGIPGGLITSLSTWLDLRLAEACYNTEWNLMPVKIQRVRLTSQVAEGIFIQFWSFSAILMMFGWKRLSILNIPIWNVLGASCDAIYRLFLNTYGIYHKKWASYPLNVLFVAITCFNFYRITAPFERSYLARMKIALKFGMAFLLGTPMFLFMNYLLFPIYAKVPSDTTKAIFSVLLPAVFIIPKAIINVCLVDLSELCRTGYSSILVVGFHTMTTIVARYLQANIEKIDIFIVICIVHGFETLLDKVTINIRLKVYRALCKSCVVNWNANEDRRRTLAMNRILAEQSLSGMILETDTIFTSCALVGILSYYYGNGNPEWNRLVHDFSIRVASASLIELFFNVLAVQVQTYYFNIPVIRVWRKRWWWIILGIIIYTAYTTLYCSEYLYRPMVSHGMYNQSKVASCSSNQSILL